MEALTLDRAKELAEEVVTEFGKGYIYPESHKKHFPGNQVASCMYVHDEKPSCLVGQILHRHGVSLEILKTYENIGAYRVTGEVTSTEDPDVLGFLSALQSRQDDGNSWGSALEGALSIYG